MRLLKSIYSELRLIINFIVGTFKFYHKLNKEFFLLESKNKNQETETTKRIYIYLNDWLSSPAVFYNIYLGLLLNKKNNTRIIFLFDKMNFYRNFLKSYINNFCIKIIIIKIKKYFNVDTLILNKKNNYNSKRYDNIIKKNIYINKIRYNSDVSPENYNKCYRYFKRKDYLNVIGNFLEILKRGNINDLFIFPGGYLNSTYTLTEILRIYKNNFYTYDAGFYKNIPNMHFCRNGIAGKVEESLNAYRSLSKVKFFKKKTLSKIKNIVLDDLNLSIKKSKKLFPAYKYNFKISSKFILITIGTGWDANSIDCDYLFKNYINFLEKTIKFLNVNFSSYQIIIKDHPSRIKIFKNKNDSLSYFLGRICNKNNIIYFGPADGDTYDLIKKSSLLISISSKTITESILLNKKAISAGKDQHYFFNIHKRFKSQADFFKFVQNSIRSENKINKKLYNKAIIQYFFNNISKYIFAKFIPLNFNWFDMSFIKIYNSYEFQIILKMLENKNTFLYQKVKDSKHFKYIKKYFKA